ncbi:MAG: N-acetylneuraminate lyase [Clostridia bacterium]|nr:N-acetylneuraminate lyase [Clostridia bacterium]
MEKLNGIFTALLTPFDDKNKINEKALADVIEMNIRKKVSGFYVGGSTAEAFMLSDDERMYLYKLVKDIVGNRDVALMGHVGSVSTLQSIKFAQLCAELGYDLMSAVSPFYYKFSFSEIKSHYYQLVDAVDLPMLIYNFPAFSGVTLNAKNISEFLCDDRFIGVKHTSNDYYAMESFKSAFPDKKVYNGFDEMFLAGLSMGADGGIGSTYNFMAEKFVEINDLFEKNMMNEALEKQKEVNRIIDCLVSVGVMQGEKEVLCQMGFDFGYARSPFSKLSPEQCKKIEKEIMPYVSK